MRKNKCIRRSLALLLSLMTGLLPFTAAWAEEGTGMATPTDLSEPAPEEQAPQSLAEVLATQGHAYVATADTAKVYGTAAMEEPDLVYTITQPGTVLLATAYEPESEYHPVRVWFLVRAGEEMCEPLSGYVAEQSLTAIPLTDEEARAMADESSAIASTDAGELLLFVAKGEGIFLPTAQATSTPETEEQNISFPTAQVALMPEMEGQNTSLPTAQATPASEAEEHGAEDCPLEGNNLPSEVPNEPGSNPTNTPSPAPQESAPCPSPSPVPEPDSPTIQVGDFLLVTTSTRAFLGVDESASDEYAGDLNLGMFVQEATVQVEAVEQDTQGRPWFRVRFLYGDDFSDGRMKWTDYSTAWVLAAETGQADTDSCTVTDFAFTREFLRQAKQMNPHMATTAMDGFTLKNISGSVGGFYSGQSSLYGSSGRDRDYPQIAKSAAHGTVYATPHFLEGFPVFCLEHNLSGPGEGSGASQSAKGPYALVDMDAFVNNPDSGGVTGVRYKATTMHALGWVLRHTYPFMALDRSDAHNEVWSRVAGQFAVREVIKQLEGPQYVRSYWDMDSFYAFSGGAPAVYLTYARWLAANGIARASITGNITASNQSLSVSGSSYIGTVTLTTDADLIRIPKSTYTLTGNSGGSDSSYYYIKSGDTIKIASSESQFAVSMESVSSSDEEARFLVGIPSVSIQKVLVPTYGVPYALKSGSVTFELSLGQIVVTKKSSDGLLLQGTVFELLNSSGTVLATATTDANGEATFASLQPGSYTVREKTPSQGYQLSTPSTQTISVVAGVTSTATFTNNRIMGRIQIVKTDGQTNKPLAGATFTVTRLSDPEADNASDIGKVVATITTNAQGTAETGLLPWGEYKVVETGVPDGYIDSGYSVTTWIK